MAMSLEQTDHFLRHVKMHADEVKLGTFKKDKEDYLKKLKEAQKVALEMSHDMIRCEFFGESLEFHLKLY